MNRFLLIVITILLFSLPAESQYWKKSTNIPSPYNNNYWLGIYFLPGNSNYGWISGFNGMVIRTTDGGGSWSGVSITGAYQLESIIFTSTTVGYTSGVEGIWKSTDGGASWFSVRPSQAGDTLHFWGSYFYDDNNGVLLGEGCAGTRQYFWRTTNGGTSWSYTNGNEYDSGLTDAILLSNGQGVATSSGRLWRSTDGGYNWTIFSTSGSNLWQEDISHIGQSFLLPYAGTNCQGNGYNGGMRFTTNDGATWRDLNIGVPMFGSFLLSATEGWACGYDRSVYYTSDAGATWTLKNCGIKSGNLDDLFFISSNVGWVVGQGVYQYSPAVQTISKTMIDFNDGCLGTPRYDTLFVANFNFGIVSANWQLQGGPPMDFRIIEPPVNFGISACDSIRFIIEFNPSSGGTKTANLRIDITGYTSFVVGLRGSAIRTTATVSDTLVIVDSADCGKTLVKSITWSATNPNEYVSSFTKTGSDDINISTNMPLQMTKNGTEMKFSILPADTGWHTARFKFRLFPCNKDTFVTVKVYAYSPIINSVKKSEIQAECEFFKDLVIPVSNTGNSNLIISNYQIMAPANGFSIVGWKSGKPQPRQIAPQGTDTLIVRYQPAIPGTYTAKLRISNNDMTKKRGNMNPYDIDLTATLLYSKLSVSDTVIQMGELCVGDTLSKRIILRNEGNLASTLKPAKNSLPEFKYEPVAKIYPSVIDKFDSILADIKFRPSRPGIFTDTIIISSFPCDGEIRIVVTGKGVITKVSLSPQIVTGTVYNHTSASSTVRVTNESTDSIIIDGYTFAPALAGWNVSISPPLPIGLAAGESKDFRITFSTLQDSALTGTLCFNVTGKCPAKPCFDVKYSSINDAVSVEPVPLIFSEQRCTAALQTKKVIIKNLSNGNAVIDSLYISPVTEGFSIQNMPALPYSIKANDSLVLNIGFMPPGEGIFNSELFVICPLSTVKTQISGSFKKTNIKPITYTYQFGKFEYCENKISHKFRLYNTGLLEDTLDVNFISNNKGFTVNSNRITIPSNDSADIVLEFNPGTASKGLNNCQIKVSSIICGNSSEITAEAEIIEPSLTITPVVLRFDNIWIGDTLTQSVTITNASASAVSLKNYSLSSNALRYEADLSLPVTINPNKSLDFIVRFIAEKSGDFTDTLLLKYTTVCDYDSSITLYSVTPGEIYKVGLRIPDYQSKPYEDMDIDVILTDSVYKFHPDSLSFDISYDPWLYKPVSVNYISGTDLLPVNAGLMPGFISIAVPKQYSNSLFQQRGPKFRISGKTFASSPNKTILDLKNINLYSAKAIDLTEYDGSLEVIPVCHPTAGQHLVLLGKLALYLRSNVISSSLEMTIDASLESKAEISFYSLSGRKISVQELDISKGTNHFDIDMQDISNGTYYFIMHASTGQVFSERILIFK